MREKCQKNAGAKKTAREKKKAERIVRNTEIAKCVCGGTYQPYRKSRHDTGKKHVAYVDVAALAP